MRYVDAIFRQIFRRKEKSLHIICWDFLETQDRDILMGASQYGLDNFIQQSFMLTYQHGKN